MSKHPLTMLSISFLVATIISSCTGKWRAPFPVADIIFQEARFENPTLGFVDADGRNYAFVRTPAYLIKPWWSSDGGKIYSLTSDASINRGYLSLWEEGGRLKTCKEFWDTETIGGIIETQDSVMALISVRDQILLVDLKRCKEQKVLVDVVNTGIFILGVSLSPDQERFAYGEEKYSYSEIPEYSIIVQGMSEGEAVRISDGINPTWSPDGKQIAYIKLDGIYVMNSDGSNSRLVSKWDVTNGDNDSKFRLDAPYPRWSPDGKWLVFHRCPPGCYGIENFKIVKVKVETGEEEIVIRGGAYPYWR